MVKPSSSEAEKAVVEDDEATSRGSAEVAGSRAATGVATALGDVAIAEEETDGGVMWQTVLQGRKPPREELPDNESETNNDPLLCNEGQGRFDTSPVG